MQIKTILTYLLVAIMAPCGLSAAEKKLSGDEITALFSGKTVNYSRVKKGNEASAYYAKDGSLHVIRDGKKLKGRWYVNDKGELCLDYGKGDRCGYIAEEDGVYKKYKEKDGEKIHIVIYNRFADGKPEKQ